MNTDTQSELDTCDLIKSYGGVKALDLSSWSVLPGEIHALAGENGAGKSTLLSIVAGNVAPDSGTVTLAGEEFHTVTPRNARHHGVALVQQELSFVPNMSIAEAIGLMAGYPRRGGAFVNWRGLNSQADEQLQFWELERSSRDRMRDLSTAERVMVGIIAASLRKPRLMILDEPTASLSIREVEHLHRLVRRLRDTGCTFVYVTHRLDEIFDLSDRVTVLRNGRKITTSETSTTNKDALIEQIAGRPIVKATSTPVVASRTEKPSLEVQDISANGFGPVSFQLHAGEVLALAGLVGSGRTEIMEAIYGTRRRSGGTVLIDGSVTRIRTPKDAVAAGLGMVPEERRSAGLVMNMSVRENMALACSARYGHPFTRMIDRKRQRHDVEVMSAKVRLKAANLEQPVRALSGGNQQKVLIGRWLLQSPRFLILDEPTRGVDVGARDDIFVLIRAAAEAGMAVLLTSSDFEDLEGLADRAVVLREGKITSELIGADITSENLVRASFGR